MLTLDHCITIGLWYAAVAGVFLCLATAGVLWWSRSQPANPVLPVFRKPVAAAGRGFWWAMIAIFALALATRIPRLNHSLWNDELMAVEMFVTGEPVEKGTYHDYSNTWKRAIYGNPDTNNHIVCTVQSRLSHGLWKALIGPSEGRMFSEVWLRFPSLLWSLAGIGLAAWLGLRLGSARLSVALAFLITIHPWSIRFATEVRGYSAAMASVLLVMICLHSVLTGGGHRWQIWAWLTAGLSLSMLSHAACAPVLAGLIGSAAVVLVWRREWRMLACLFAANALAATIFLDLFGPSLPQISHFMKGKANARLSPVCGAWWLDIISAFASGTDWRYSHHSVRHMPPWQAVGLLGGFYGLLGMGIGSAWKRCQPFLKLLIVGSVIAGGMVLAMNVCSAHAMLSWYLCPLLPGVALCMAVGWVHRPRTASLLVTLWIGCLIPLLWQQVTEARQPLRNAVEIMATRWPQAMTAYLGISDTFVASYLPATHVLERSPDQADQIKELQVLDEQAKKQGVPLVLWCGGNQTQRAPAVVRYLLSQGFRLEVSLAGFEEALDVAIYARPSSPP